MPPKAKPVKAKGRKRGSNEDPPAAANAAHPSTDAAQAMSDGRLEQPPSGSDAARPLIKKAKLAPPAAPAVAAAASVSSSVASDSASTSPSSSAAADSSASSSSSAAASASASSAPTPCGRLDADSLSVVFSFFNMQDFLRAVRVSRHWRSARVKKTAWPAFSLSTMIQSLRDDDFDSPQRRKFELSIKSGNKTKLAALLGQPGVMDLCRFVTEMKLVQAQVQSMGRVDPEAQAKAARASAVMLPLIPQFASLAALTLDGFAIPPETDDPAIQLFDALSSRLLMLGLFRCGPEYERQLHRLSSLRILVLGWTPSARSLLPLHQLVYLRIEHEPLRYFERPSPLLGSVIRWLSVHHALRSLSVEGFTADQALGCLSALLSCEAADPRDVDLASLSLQPQLDRSVPCALTDLSIQAVSPATAALLNSTPSLTRLQTSTERLHGGLSPALQLTLPQLQQLRLQGNAAFSGWDQLAHCTALRVVHLTQVRRFPQDALSPLPQATLRSLLRAWAATLEECRLELRMELDAEEPHSGNKPWPELVACHRLRILELRLSPGQSLPAGLVAALQGLPSFHSLVLGFDGAELCQLPPNLLSAMAQSNSFNTLHFNALSAGSRDPDFVQSAEIAEGRGLSAMLSVIAEREPALLTAQTISRLRVVGHHCVKGVSRVHSFRIVQTTDQPKWHREF